MGADDIEDVWYPTVEDIITIHDDILDEYPETETGIRNRDDIAYTIEFISEGRFGERPETLHEKAFHLLRLLTANHPFVDGNGRVGRLLIVLMLIASDILVHPLFYLSSYIRRNRDEYTDLLLAVNEEGDWNAWLEFFLNGIREQADEAFSRAKLLLQLRTAYRERYGDAAPSVRALVDAIFVEPIFTVSRAADLIEMSNPAANNAVNRLEDDGLLEEQTGQERYREFQATDVLEVLNRDVEEVPSPGELIAE